MALITAAEARLHIPGLTGTAEDTNIGTLITRCGVFFARHCGYPPATTGASPSMETASYTLYSGPGGYVDVLDARTLRIRVWPVTAIASIYDDVEELYAASTLVASGDYTLIRGDEGLVRLDSDSTHGGWQGQANSLRNVKAAVTAGFTTVPSDLAEAACLMVAHWWNLRHVAGKSNVSAGSGNTSLRDETMPASVRELLMPYRLPQVVL